MRERVVLGVDVGTSSTKGVLVTFDGTVLRSAVREHTVDRPAPGHVEADPETWWSELTSIAAELTGGDDAVHVVAVGLSGMGPCVALTDADGVPTRPAILYGVDTRATEQIARLEQELGRSEVLARCGSVLTSQAAGPKIAWVAQHEPDVYRRSRRFFMPASYLVHRLTGEYVLDHHSASQCTPLYDAVASTWHATWADLVAPGIELPRLAWADEVAGTVAALPDGTSELPGVAPGTPVTVGTIDAWSEAVSVGATRPGDLMLMYGTTMFLVATTDGPVRSESLWGTAGVTSGTSCLAGGMSTSGAITGWLRDLTRADFPTLVAEAEASGPGARGLLMLPYLAGERTPVQDPDARGVVAGLTLEHGRGDLYRAALEATAFGVRHIVETLVSAGARPARVLAVGGGVQGGLWAQIVSDVTGLDQQIASVTIGASLGAARLAVEACGLADTSAWNPVAMTVRRRPELAAIYDERYRAYRELYPATRDIVHRLAAAQRAATPAGSARAGEKEAP